MADNARMSSCVSHRAFAVCPNNSLTWPIPLCIWVRRISSSCLCMSNREATFVLSDDFNCNAALPDASFCNALRPRHHEWQKKGKVHDDNMKKNRSDKEQRSLALPSHSQASRTFKAAGLFSCCIPADPAGPKICKFIAEAVAAGCCFAASDCGKNSSASMPVDEFFQT